MAVISREITSAPGHLLISEYGVLDTAQRMAFLERKDISQRSARFRFAGCTADIFTIKEWFVFIKIPKLQQPDIQRPWGHLRQTATHIQKIHLIALPKPQRQ